MSHASSAPIVKTIKARKNESLKIDLGRVYEGSLESWMKRNPNEITHRTFTIIDNRYLFLTKEQASDFFDIDNNLIEGVEGKWLFDVKQTIGLDGARVVFRGVILFSNKITNNIGYN